MDFQITQDEVYAIIGELELARRKLNGQVNSLVLQVTEMSAEITKLHTELEDYRGRLGESHSSE